MGFYKQLLIKADFITAQAYKLEKSNLEKYAKNSERNEFYQQYYQQVKEYNSLIKEVIEPTGLI